ncbi:DNA repair protein RadC [uncultured Ilyobacter sp.]|jgi:DNA repair protein RadC|uniref:RadC family protein n=1 Tax=uncultured Ilyobacter sp. TaxID=544433 RepID=UPI0029C02989|nr:DNA repair protein RadC [uncultured Ilyobacter sp.]
MKDTSGHRKRLREKYIKGGYDSFLDYEKLELLLTYSIVRKDVKPVAKELLKRFKSLEGVMKAPFDELLKVDGLGEGSVIFLKLISETSKDIFKGSYSKQDVTTISGTRDLLAFLRNDIGFSPIEEFKVIFLDTANNLLCEETLFKGTIDRSGVYPRNIVEKVIKYGAKSVIFAHNHPSGNLNPSKADIDFTDKIKEVLNAIEIRVLDHMIITRDSYFSFLEKGLI